MHMPNSLNPHKRIHGLSFLAVCFIYADASLKNIIHKSQHELSFLAGCYICMCFCLFFLYGLLALTALLAGLLVRVQVGAWCCWLVLYAGLCRVQVQTGKETNTLNQYSFTFTSLIFSLHH